MNNQTKFFFLTGILESSTQRNRLLESSTFSDIRKYLQDYLNSGVYQLLRLGVLGTTGIVNIRKLWRLYFLDPTDRAGFLNITQGKLSRYNLFVPRFTTLFSISLYLNSLFIYNLFISRFTTVFLLNCISILFSTVQDLL